MYLGLLEDPLTKRLNTTTQFARYRILHKIFEIKYYILNILLRLFTSIVGKHKMLFAGTVVMSKVIFSPSQHK